MSPSAGERHPANPALWCEAFLRQLWHRWSSIGGDDGAAEERGRGRETHDDTARAAVVQVRREVGAEPAGPAGPGARGAVGAHARPRHAGGGGAAGLGHTPGAAGAAVRVVGLRVDAGAEALELAEDAGAVVLPGEEGGAGWGERRDATRREGHEGEGAREQKGVGWMGRTHRPSVPRARRGGAWWVSRSEDTETRPLL
jgi:hypothetical protein